MIQNSDNFSPILGGARRRTQGKVPGVEMVSTLRYSQVRINGAGAAARLGSGPSERQPRC